MKSELYNINGVIYRVVVVDPKVIDDDHGACHYETALIQLSKKLAPSPMAAVKRHELAHAAMWESGARSMLSRLLPNGTYDDVEEDLLDRFLPVYHNIRRVR